MAEKATWIRYQVHIALVLTLLIYFQVGNWKFVFKSQSLSSQETRKFISLLDQPEQLKHILQRKVQHNPDDYLAWTLLSGCYHQLGEQDHATFAAEKAMRIQQKKSILAEHYNRQSALEMLE